MCYSPIVIKQSINDYYSYFKNNSKRLDNLGIYPFEDYLVKDRDDNFFNILVPCGKCFQCRKSRVNNWVLRVHHEYNNYNRKMCFTTLTYNDENNIDKSLDYSHFQKFIKRLRFHLKNIKISYICVGEYGFKSDRKHFHAVILGIDDSFKKLIDKLWNYGFTYTKRCDINAVRYVLKYSFKSVFKDNSYYINKGLVAPMFRCSKGFGKDLVLSDFRNILSRGYFLVGGFRYAIPRYYYKVMVEKCLIPNSYRFHNYNQNEHLYNILIDSLEKNLVLSLLEDDFSKSDFNYAKNIVGYTYNKGVRNSHDKFYDFIKNFREKI